MNNRGDIDEQTRVIRTNGVWEMQVLVKTDLGECCEERPEQWVTILRASTREQLQERRRVMERRGH